MIPSLLNAFTSIILVFLIALSCLALGSLLMRRLPEAVRKAPGALLYSAALGAGAVSLILYLCGWLRLYYSETGLALLAPGLVLLFLGARNLLRRQKLREIPSTDAGSIARPTASSLTTASARAFHSSKAYPSPQPQLLERLFWAAAAFSMALSLVAALAPPTARDSLIYHLVAPKQYVGAHGFVEMPWNVFTYVPMHLEMLYTWGLMLGQDNLPALIHWFYGFLTAAAAWLLARRLGAERSSAALAAAVFITVPVVWRLMGNPYSDLPMAFYTTLALDAFLRWREGRQPPWLWICGVMLGLATSSRYQALVLWPILGLGVLLSLREDEDEVGVKPTLFVLCGAFGLAALVMLPWWLRNGIWTHNPLFPYLMQFFPTHSTGWDADRQALSLQILHQYGGSHKTPLDYLLLPWNLAFHGIEDNPAHFDGVLGPALLLGIAPFLLWRRLPSALRYLLGFVLLYGLFWTFSSQQVRWLVYVLPSLLAAVAVISSQARADRPAESRIGREKTALQNSTIPAWGSQVVMAAAGVCVIWGLCWIESQFAGSGVGPVVLGQVSREAYLAEHVPTYPEQSYISEHIPASAKVMLIDAGSDTYYLDRPEFHDSVFEDWSLVQIAKAAPNAPAIGARLHEMGITHLLIGTNLLFGQDTSPFVDSGPDNEAAGRRLKEYLQIHTREVFTANHGYTVRELL